MPMVSVAMSDSKDDCGALLSLLFILLWLSFLLLLFLLMLLF